MLFPFTVMINQLQISTIKLYSTINKRISTMGCVNAYHSEPQIAPQTAPQKGTPAIRTQNQQTAHSAQCYLITCMDFRLIDDIVHFMNGKGYNNNYDQFILAGASLGFTQDRFPHWGQTLMDHMGIGRTLHDFREIIIIDHLDCGAYRKFYPDMKTPDEERQRHRERLQLARDQLAGKFPTMKFQAYLMNVKGDCEEIKIDTKKTLNVKDIRINENDKFLASITENDHK